MNPPRIRSLLTAPAELADALGRLPCAPDGAFVVTASGRFGGCWLSRGDILVCDGAVRPWRAVILLDRGDRRPRLGHATCGAWLGDRGEACRRSRWRAFGAITAIWTRDGQGWHRVTDTLDLPGTSSPGLGHLGWGPRADRPRRVPRGGAEHPSHRGPPSVPAVLRRREQLSLFAEAA